MTTPKTSAIGFAASASALARTRSRRCWATSRRAAVGPTETIEQLVRSRRARRDAVNLARRTRFACLGSFKTMDRFDWSHPGTGRARSRTSACSSSTSSSRAKTSCSRAGSGLGKTMIAQNLAPAALVRGSPCGSRRSPAALADLLNQESMPAIERRLRRYTLPDLLILDELGYVPCDSRAADILFNIISRRHEQRSTIITTNLAYKQWGTAFPTQPAWRARRPLRAALPPLEIVGES